MKTIPRLSKKGMTLLELTVVILVLLALIAILFVGGRAWKRGADRAASVLMIRNVQNAVRSYANMNEKVPGGDVSPSDIFGPGKYLEVDPTAAGSKHPAGDPYSYAYVANGGAKIPQIGELYIHTTGGTEPEYYNPDPDEIAEW
jgi:prepilin-type N-terminal cleavage/methylation domain-containing protein